jgi:hypothetical protein
VLQYPARSAFPYEEIFLTCRVWLLVRVSLALMISSLTTHLQVNGCRCYSLLSNLDSASTMLCRILIILYRHPVVRDRRLAIFHPRFSSIRYVVMSFGGLQVAAPSRTTANKSICQPTVLRRDIYRCDVVITIEVLADKRSRSSPKDENSAHTRYPDPLYIIMGH